MRALLSLHTEQGTSGVHLWDMRDKELRLHRWSSVQQSASHVQLDQQALFVNSRTPHHGEVPFDFNFIF